MARQIDMEKWRGLIPWIPMQMKPQPSFTRGESMKIIINSWYQLYGSKPVTASEIIESIQDNNNSKICQYLRELSSRAAATQLGKFLDKSQKLWFSIPTLFGETNFSISRILNGSYARYTLTEISGQDIIQFTPYQDSFISLVGGSIKIQLGKDLIVSFDNLNGDPTIEEVGYKDQAKYVFLDPTGTKRYYVRNGKLGIFCKQFGIISEDLSMVARGARKHHHGWTGYRVDKPKVKEARLRLA